MTNTHTIDLSELARLMLTWEKLNNDLAVYENAIMDTVLTLGKTQTVGNVRASYSGGRKTYDYQEAADGHLMVSDATKKLFTIIPEPRIDWRGICKHVGIDIIPFTKSPPRVTVKLLA